MPILFNTFDRGTDEELLQSVFSRFGTVVDVRGHPQPQNPNQLPFV